MFRIFYFFFLLAVPCYANLEGDEWIFHGPEKDFHFPRGAQFRGTPMVALTDLVSRLGLKAQYDPDHFQITLTDSRTKNVLKFFTYSTRLEAHLNGQSFVNALSRHPEFSGVKLFVPIDFGDRALRPLLTGKPSPEPNFEEELQRADVVLDPGHGGNDYGASVEVGKTIYREKDLVLIFAKELATNLSGHGLKVALTRRDDFFLTLPERTRFANKEKAKVFLSIHMNSEPRAKQSGTETFILSLDKGDTQGRRAVARESQTIPEDLSEGVERTLSDLRAQANFEKSLEWAKLLMPVLAQKSAGAAHSVKTGPFYVLYGAEMPALLLEMGYLTHAEDRVAMLSPQKRASLVNGVAQTLARTLKTGITPP